MKYISRVKSLINFNERVLFEGKVTKKLYSTKDLYNKLFFNSIFISNMEEVFMKYTEDDINIIKNNYLNDLKIYNNNIKSIIKYLETTLNTQINLRKYKLLSQNDFKVFNFNEDLFKNGTIYYVTLTENNDFIVNYLKEPDQLIKNSKNFFNLDLAAKKSLNKIFKGKTISFKITYSDWTKEVSKIEFDQFSTEFKEFTKLILSPDSLIIINPWINLRKLIKFVSKFIESEPIKQKFIDLSPEKIFKKDYLIQFPEVSFESYLEFLRKCIRNKDCLIIFMTIYRIGESSTILEILSEAVKRGVKVLVNIELDAYGEKINTEWKNKFEKAGIKVYTYGKDQFKIHSKITFVKFNNGQMISQIGTGNYHTETTKQYTDMMLFTSVESIGISIIKLIRLIMRKEIKIQTGSKILITRHNFKEEFFKQINNQIKLKEKGLIIFKGNSFDDYGIFSKIKEALEVGVKVYLIIRGPCTLVTEKSYPNLVIKSLVWDKLEHSRVYWFGRNSSNCYIGSLDLITNKIDKRIETLIKITDSKIKDSISNYLLSYIIDTERSWFVNQEGKYFKYLEKK